jgi:hypothetical protein
VYTWLYHLGRNLRRLGEQVFAALTKKERHVGAKEFDASMAIEGLFCERLDIPSICRVDWENSIIVALLFDSMSWGLMRIPHIKLHSRVVNVVGRHRDIDFD